MGALVSVLFLVMWELFVVVVVAAAAAGLFHHVVRSITHPHSCHASHISSHPIVNNSVCVSVCGEGVC
jgi:hypothetical protein